MTKKSSKYWQNRFDQVEQSANNKSVAYARKLEKKYKTAAQEIDGKINAWYQRIAQNNNVSVTEARRLLSTSELKEFKWTVQDYIKYGQENAIDQSWMKELENASAKFHINRLEALKLECRQQIEVALANGQQSMYDTLADVYKDSFYHSCFEIQTGVGVGFDVSALDDGYVSRLLNKPWSLDGENFSSKVWKNKTKLLNNLDQELSKMVLTGSSPQKAIQNIRKTMDTSLYNAKRLVLTEQAYFCTAAQKDAFTELDVDEYEIVSTLDSKTSEVCREQDGKHYPVKDMTPGVNAPPFHVFCRTTTCPYFDDEFTVDDKRVAKDEEGNWYEVPANMTYKEWKQTFVDGGSKDGLTPINNSDNVRVEDFIAFNKNSGEKQRLDEFVSNMEGTEKDRWIDAFSNTDYEMFDGTEDEISYYDPNNKKVHFNVNNSAETAFHETAHAIDDGRSNFEINIGDEKKPIMKTFTSASDCLEYIMNPEKSNSDLKNFADIIGVNADDYFFTDPPNDVFTSFNTWAAKIYDDYDDAGFGAVSDILSGISDDYTGGSLIYGGHTTSYWQQKIDGRASLVNQESWANFCSLKATKNEKTLKLLKQVVPNRYEALDEVYRKVFIE